MSARLSAMALVLMGVFAASPAHADSEDFARMWLGVAGSVDVTYLPYASDVCALTAFRVPANSLHYYCTNPDGTDFPSRVTRAENDSLVHGEAGPTRSALVAGNIRLLASAEYALDVRTLVGVRIGYVTHGYTGEAAYTDGRGFHAPLHLEARATRLFGDAPLGRTGFAPLVLADAGVAEMDAGRVVHLHQTTVAGDRPKVTWRIGGPAFLGAGGGVRWAFTPRFAVTAVTRLAFGLGSGGILAAIVPEAGLQWGF